MAINFDRLLVDLETVDTQKVLSTEKSVQLLDYLKSVISEQTRTEFRTLMWTLKESGTRDEIQAIFMLACLKQESTLSIFADRSGFLWRQAVKLLPMEMLRESNMYNGLKNVVSDASRYGHYIDKFNAVPPERITFLLNMFYPQLHKMTEEREMHPGDYYFELGPLLAKIPADYLEALLRMLHDDSPFNPNSKIPLSADIVLSAIKRLDEEQIDAFCLALKEKVSDLVKDSNKFYDLILGFEKWSMDKSHFEKVAPIFMSNLDKMKDSLSFSEYRTQELVSFLMKLKEDYPKQQFLSLQDAIPASIKNIDDFNALMAYPEDKQVLFERLGENLALVKRLVPILAGDSARPTVSFMQNLKADAFEAFFTRLPTDTLLQKAWSIACLADENQRVQAAVKAVTPTGVLSFLKGGQPTVATEENLSAAVKKQPMAPK
jgi:hypothetical protein